MEQLNRIELRGNVGTVRLLTYEGTRVAHLTLATNLAYKDREGAAVIETTWHNISAWEGRGVQDLENISVGSKVYVQGRLRNQRFIGSDGIEHFSTDVLASRLVLIDDDDPLQCEM